MGHYCFQPTYKELKHVIKEGKNATKISFQPTYKELKQLFSFLAQGSPAVFSAYL